MNVTKLNPVPTFEDFWAKYPAERRCKKAQCKRLWDAITDGGYDARTKSPEGGGFMTIRLEATPEEIMAGLERWAKQLPRNPQNFDLIEPQFIVTSPVWLNQGRWEDWV